jgi:rare lipoprotein A
VRFRGAALVLAAAILSAGCGHKKTARRLPSRPAPTRPARIGDVETGVASWYGYPYHGRRAANGEVYDMEEFTAAHKTLPFETWVRVENLTNGKKVEVRITDRGPFIEGRIIDLSRAAARAIDLIGPGIAQVKVVVIRPPARPPEAASAPIPAPVPVPPPSPTPVAPPMPVAAEAAPPAESSTPPPAESPVTPGAPPAAPVEPAPAPAPPPDAVPAPPALFAVQVGAFRDRAAAERLRAAMESRYGAARLVERPAAGFSLWRVLVGAVATEAEAEELAQRIRREGNERIDAFVVRL